MDDCLRCHGMHFEGGVRDLVTPVNAHGPWSMLKAGPARSGRRFRAWRATRCTAQGTPLQKAGAEAAVAGPRRRSTGRRWRCSIAARRRTCRWPPAAAGDAGRRSRPVKNESGPAPGALLPMPRARSPTMQVGTGDDRTRHRRPRRHQLPGLPSEARPADAGFLRHLPSQAVQLRPGRGEDGYHVQQAPKAGTTSTG